MRESWLRVKMGLQWSESQKSKINSGRSAMKSRSWVLIITHLMLTRGSVHKWGIFYCRASQVSCCGRLVWIGGERTDLWWEVSQRITLTDITEAKHCVENNLRWQELIIWICGGGKICFWKSTCWLFPGESGNGNDEISRSKMWLLDELRLLKVVWLAWAQLAQIQI